MKRKIYYIGNLLLMCMLILLSACDDIIVDPSPTDNNNNLEAGDGSKEVPIALDISNLFNLNPPTYGTTYPSPPDLVPGNAAENAIHDIVVYIFDNMFVCEKIISHALPTPIPIPIGPVMVRSGMKHFVVVVNGDGKLTLEKTTPSNVSYSSLLKTVTDGIPTLPETPFLMTGIKNNIPVPNELPSSSPHPVSVEITRACAKITMQITKSHLAASHDIRLKSVTMFRGADRVALFNAPSPNPAQHMISVSKNTFDPDNILVNAPSYILMHDTIYTYENLCGPDTTRAVRFEILTEVNSPTNERKAKFYLATHELSTGDSIFNVYRNHWYDIKVNFVDPGMDSIYIQINACPWNVVDPIDVTEGHGAIINTASPLKLVKNFTINDWGNTSFPFAAVQSHSKGASWIDVKVTNGTPWKLDVTDNTARNQGVYYSLDSATWLPLPTTGLVGDDMTHRVYIYRWYRENEERLLEGPSLYVGLSQDNGVSYNYYQGIVIQPRELTPFPTNSYVLRPQRTGNWPINETRAYIPLAGVYAYWEDYLYANGQEIPVGNIYPELLWDDQGGGVVKNWRTINASDRDSAYLYVEAEQPGNAVIAMKVGTTPFDTIYWSFHLWVTEYNPYEAAGQKFYESPDQKNVFMDRNLGALANVYDPAGNARGLLYQFGRKDPFPGGSNWTNTTKLPYTTGQIPSAATVFRPLNAIPKSINNPKTFYLRGLLDYTLSIEDANLWATGGGRKTAFDPCPEGWRIPVSVGSSAAWAENNSNPRNFTYVSGEEGCYSPLLGYYPLTGYFESLTPPFGLVNTTLHTYFWSSRSASSNINENWNGLKIIYDPTPSIGHAQTTEKSYGASVRCVVDVNYLKEKGRLGLFGNGTDNLLREIGP